MITLCALRSMKRGMKLIVTVVRHLLEAGSRIDESIVALFYRAFEAGKKCTTRVRAAGYGAVRRAEEESVKTSVSRAADVFQEGVLERHRMACRSAVVRWVGASIGDSGASSRDGSACLACLVGMLCTQRNVVGCSQRGVVSVTWCDGGVGAGKEGRDERTDGGCSHLDPVGEVPA